jgi:peptidyl-prolyl cis-trans isomerase C
MLLFNRSLRISRRWVSAPSAVCVAAALLTGTAAFAETATNTAKNAATTPTTAAALAPAIITTPASSTPLATLNQNTITVGDLQADLLRLPPEARQKAAADPMTVQQAVTSLLVRKALAERAEKEGLQNTPEYQAQLRLLQERLLSDAWLAKVDAASALPDDEVHRLAQMKYQAEAFTRFKQPDQVKIRHILTSKDAEGKAQAEKLLAELKAGADFVKLAEANSKDPGSAARGGDLGLVAPGRMVPDFEKAAFGLKAPGDLSEIVETGFGYHIIKLDEIVPGKIAPFMEVKDGLKNEVANKIRNDGRNAAAADLFKAVELKEDAMQQFVEAARQAK